MSIMTVIYFVLILSVIIIIHELGHLIAAKHFGVYCKEFSIGMGPMIYQKQVGETAWSVRALPIGGYVAMAGETLEDDGEDEEDIPFERTINGIKPWKQIIVMAAGAIMNILLAWVIFVGITAYQGQIAIPGSPVITSFSENSPAEKAGFKVNDEIIKVQNGTHSEKVDEFDDVVEFINYFQGETTFTVLRDGKEVEVKMTPVLDEEENIYKMGVYHDNYDVKKINLLEAIPYGTQKMVDSVSTILNSLGKLIQGIGLKNLSGPVGIFKMTDQITQTGFLTTMAFVGLLSVNVGIFNLLPIPILDGGRIFITLIEMLIGRKLSERVQNVIMTIGLVAIVALMLYATWNDITRLF
ncbi:MULTISPECIES: RIP metalloprotease RseP [Bacillota]|jgi:regulator of sigma E protease|uniref:Zinc metalloprotease n=3 Tax=Erysipelotrichaceae TaxID=128827 RepID=A0A7G9GLP4_9FIRM|nr:MULTISPECIES: RIP metalloprotease RseP [Bacillota]QNM11726.1 RIP metalloprotease RseP [[Eubacterium] hominis]MCH4285024.1 RIP metalloprotease RseP [Amedibacillus hominis]RGB56057.1 RIP metalloprotease RseP [Absiella sp. AM22-9]RGB61818.1 RIP metalloprotease RseP [Absiella sp. AM10-20]RGB70361.1 RIP metalloprotease RseP [Absiella sp. AM09-45]